MSNPPSPPGNPLPSLAELRREYGQAGLNKKDLLPDPLLQFQKWLAEAIRAGVAQPHAMIVATTGPGRQPSTRLMLLREVNPRGFVFLTHYESRKARELAENSYAALNFPWLELERQVNVGGPATRISREASEALFQSWPRAHRLAAIAFPQSLPVPDRAALEQRLQRLAHQYPGDDIPLPPFLGGYLLVPDQIEFWQGRPNRLHDRFLYSKQSDGSWTIQRLAP